MCQALEFVEEQKEDFLQKHYLQSYIYFGNEEILEKAGEELRADRWHRAILIEADECFFDAHIEAFPEEIRKELHRDFYYLNLNSRQSLMLFEDEYCDYALVAKNTYVLLKQRYRERFYLAVSRKFDGHKSLPGIMEQLERQMEEKFYHRDTHVFTSEEEKYRNVSKEVQDSQLIEKISEDITRKDTRKLWEHYGFLEEKYRDNSKFSAMYVKFVFSNVIQELFQEKGFAREYRLADEVDKVYGCFNMNQILEITRESITKYVEFLEQSMGKSRAEVAAAKEYISQHCAENLRVDAMAEEVGMPPGYLSFLFKNETGVSIHRFIRMTRMDQARSLLKNTDMDVAEVSRRLGYADVNYFYRSYCEYFGERPRG